MDTEIWRRIIIDGIETKYKISDRGRIRRKKKILSQRPYEYMKVTLHIYGKRKTFSVHRLVADEFIPNPDNKPFVNHKDLNKQNNNVENLEWCTGSENTLHHLKINPRMKRAKEEKITPPDGGKKTYPGYIIYKDGKIFSEYKENFLSERNREYITVNIFIDGKQKQRAIHSLVAKAYLPNPDNKPVVNHKDGNKLNNNVENLEWCTRKENNDHAFESGLNFSRGVIQYSPGGEFIQKFKSLSAASENTKTSKQNIQACCKGRSLTANCYAWRYADCKEKFPFSKKINQYSLEGEYIMTFDSFTDLYQKLNFTPRFISMACKDCYRNGHRCYGYVWKFAFGGHVQRGRSQV